MKSFKEYLNEIKLQKSSGYKKGDKVVFNKPDGREAKVAGYPNFTGIVQKDAKYGEDVLIKSPEFTEAYGDDVAKVSPDKIKTKI